MTLCLLLFLQFASVQSLSANERKLPKGTANDKSSNSMNCFYCRHSNKAHKDLSDPLIERSECLSPEMFANQSQFQRQCATHETFCMTSVSSMNGFFVEMRRDCAERCRPGCQESGYGLFSRQCARCCRSPLCNHFDGRNFLLNDDSAIQQMSTADEGFSFGEADEEAADSVLENHNEKSQKESGAIGGKAGKSTGGGGEALLAWVWMLICANAFLSAI